MWEISTGKESKKNLVLRWTQIYSQMNHKCHALKELCPEFLFLLMSCFWLCGSLLAYVPDWHPPRKFSEISDKFSPTLCMSFVFYYTSSWVFHLSHSKTHYPSYCSGLKYKCVYTERYVCIYVYRYLSMCVYIYNMYIYIYIICKYTYIYCVCIYKTDHFCEPTGIS